MFYFLYFQKQYTMPLRKSSDKNSLFPLINKISTHFFSDPPTSFAIFNSFAATTDDFSVSA